MLNSVLTAPWARETANWSMMSPIMTSVRTLLYFNLPPFSIIFLPCLNWCLQPVFLQWKGTSVLFIVGAKRITGAIEIDQSLASGHGFDIKRTTLWIGTWNLINLTGWIRLRTVHHVSFSANNPCFLIPFLEKIRSAMLRPMIKRKSTISTNTVIISRAITILAINPPCGQFQKDRRLNPSTPQPKNWACLWPDQLNRGRRSIGTVERVNQNLKIFPVWNPAPKIRFIKFGK